MSVTNGMISGSLIRKETPPYGRFLSASAFLPLEGCLDAACSPDGGTLYAACRGELRIYDISQKDGPPRETGCLKGIGVSRQIAVSDDGVACITARTRGLYVVSVRDPAAPRLLAHLDTLELATGVCCYEHLCLVADRHMGVEVWDLSVPEKPAFLSSFCAGEAQSVCVDGGYAYVGDWMNRQVNIVDIRDPRRPSPVSSFPVDGYADGVFVRNGVCYAATGHHSRQLKNRRQFDATPFVTDEMLSGGYGRGHGLTLCDVSIPESPEFLSEVKFPPLYGHVPDTWRVTADGQYAYVADTQNGLFVVDVRDPLSPITAAQFHLPLSKRPRSETPPPLQQIHEPVTGVVSAEGTLYAAGPESGLYVLPFSGARHAVPPAPPVPDPPALTLRKVFSCAGQVHTVAEQDGCLFAACGHDGLYALSPEDLTVRHHLATRGFAHDVIRAGKVLCVCEGDSGITFWRYSAEEGFSLLNRTERENAVFRQAVWCEQTGVIVAESSETSVTVFRVSENGGAAFAAHFTGLGMLYHHHLVPTAYQGRFVCLLSLAKGPMFLDTQTLQPPEGVPQLASFCPFEEGLGLAQDRLYMIRNRRIGVYSAPAELDTPAGTVPGARLTGQVFPLGASLLLLNRKTGHTERIDLNDPLHPRLSGASSLPMRPEYAARLAGRDLLCCGHDGLYEIIS